jgi:hypothetical protein
LISIELRPQFKKWFRFKFPGLDNALADALVTGMFNEYSISNFERIIRNGKLPLSMINIKAIVVGPSAGGQQKNKYGELFHTPKLAGKNPVRTTPKPQVVKPLVYFDQL